MINAVTTITYPVVETFHSVQGEGYWTGTNAFFIRLGGCDVGCWFCDTKESWNPKQHPEQPVVELANLASQAQPAIVIVTGGEPLMHDLTALTDHLHQQRLRVHLETSGAHPLSGTFDWITLSPKRFKVPHTSIYEQVQELKVVVADRNDLRWAEEQSQFVSAGTLKYLQPEWTTPASRDLVVDYVLHHPDWRVSLQTHKFLEVR